MKMKRGFISIPKKWLAVTSVVLGLLIVDYGFKVYELARLHNYGENYADIWTQWDASYETNYLKNTPGVSNQSFSINGYDSFVLSSGEASVDMYVLKTRIERSFVLPWHNKVQYAYQDSINFLDEWHKYLGFINWEYTDNQYPLMNFQSDHQISALSAVAVKSGEDARPWLRLLEFLYT